MDKNLHVSKESTLVLDYIAAFTDMGLKEGQRERLSEWSGIKMRRSGMIRRTLVFNNQLSKCRNSYFFEDSQAIFLCLFKKKIT